METSFNLEEGEPMAEAKKQKKEFKRNCKGCDKEFVTKNSIKLFCSVHCRDKFFTGVNKIRIEEKISDMEKQLEDIDNSILYHRDRLIRLQSLRRQLIHKHNLKGYMYSGKIIAHSQTYRY